MYVLDFIQSRFHSTSPGGSESMCVKTGDRGTKGGLRVEGAGRAQAGLSPKNGGKAVSHTGLHGLIEK